MDDNKKFKAALTRAQQRLEKRLTAIFAELAPAPPSLVDAMRYASLDGGKRFRPFLAIESAALFAADPNLALDTAAAIECIHCYSLIHDDLPVMDNDELRRGRPTLWKWSDEATAILAGDALQAVAFDLLSKSDAPNETSTRLDLINGLAKAAGPTGMVAGQVRDIAAEQSDEPTDFASVLQIHGQKTGALITFAAEAGAIIAGKSIRERAALKLYGEKLGLAFQLKDDLLDIAGNANELGKTPGKDLDAGKATLVTALGQERANKFLKDLCRGAIYALEPFGDKADTLRQAVQFVSERRC